MRMIFVVVLSLILVFSCTAFATERQHEGSLAGGDTVYDWGFVGAWVGPYAKVDFTGGEDLIFTGQAFQRAYGTKLFRVETNCFINGKLEGTILGNIADRKPWTLKTWYKLGNSGWKPADPIAVFNYPIGHIGVYTQAVQFSAQTGEVSDQHYGQYFGLVKLTVSHP